MSTHTTKSRTLKRLSLNGRIGLKLKLFEIWFDGDIPRGKINLWNPLSYILMILALFTVSLWKLTEAAKEIYSVIVEAYFGLSNYRKQYGEPTWFKDLPD